MTAATLAPRATLRAAVYARISMDRDDTELGVIRQREACETLCKARGYELAGIYTDNDMAASHGSYRPEYDRLMRDVAAGKADVIVAFQQSRLWRNRRERAEGIDQLRQHAVSVVMTKGMDLDLSTSYGRAVADMGGVMDSWESEVKAERVQEAQAQAVAAGKWIGGPRPFGWNLIPDPAAKGTKTGHRLVLPVVNKAEADEINRLARDLLAGRSLNALCKDLNERGVRTAWGRAWTPRSLRLVLTRPRNYGAGEFQGQTYPGTWPPILEEATVREVEALLADPARRTNTSGNAVKYLMSGIARCGACRKPVKSGSTTNRDGSRHRVYKCPDEHTRRGQEAVDHVVTSDIMLWLRSMTRAERLALLSDADPSSADAAELARLRAKLAEFADMLREDEIDRATYRQQSAVLKGQISALERSMSKVSRVPVLAEVLSAEDVRAVWDSLPLDKQRSVVEALVVVTIKPGVRLRAGQVLNGQNVGVGIRHVLGAAHAPVITWGPPLTDVQRAQCDPEDES